MPDVRLERDVAGAGGSRRPRRSAKCLQAIADQEGPWRGFALHISFGELHLPDVGYVAVPIRLQVTKREDNARMFDITFNSMNLPAAFPDVQRQHRGRTCGPRRV